MKKINISEIINDKIIENYGLICPKCREKINIKKINDIILNNDKITTYTNKIKLQIENIINNYSNDLLSNINNILKMIKEEIKINNEIIFNLMTNNKEINKILNSNKKKEIPNKEVMNEIDIKKDTKYIKNIISNYLKYINNTNIKKKVI